MPYARTLIADWIWGEAALLERAQEILAADQENSTALFPDWAGFLLYGSPYGGFNPNSEPAHDGLRVRELKNAISRDDFRRADWGAVGRMVERSVCHCEHIDHEKGGKHPDLSVPAGRNEAHWIGRICDDCAGTCMSGLLVTE